jgi:hypothetical protein
MGNSKWTSVNIPDQSSDKSHNAQLAKELWEVSEKMTGVYFDF